MSTAATQPRRLPAPHAEPTELPDEMAELIDGKAIAASLRDSIAARAEAVRRAGGTVRLDAILVDHGDNPARQYAERQGQTCEKVGIDYTLHELGRDCTQADLISRVRALSDDDSVNAIMLHLPLPEAVDTYAVQRRIDPDKDVEGVNPANIGNIVYGRSSLAPCTALAAVHMLTETGVDLRGKRCCVVGAGDVVGKPIAVLLMRHEATVFSCNVHTRGVEDLCRSADVVIACAGVPELVQGAWLRPGAVVIDVGVNRVERVQPDGETKTVTVGDVAFDDASRVASKISPVPGGVGPVTVAMLLSNVVQTAEARLNADTNS